MRRLLAVVRAVVPVVPLVLVAVLVGRLGHGSLAPPPITEPDALGPWLAQRDAVTAAFAVLRLVVAALAWYLAVITAVGALATVAGADRLAGAAERALPAPLRRALSGLAGAGLATAAVIGVVEGDEVAAPTPVAERLVLLPGEGTAPGDGTATMTVLDEAAPEAPPPAETWTVAPGESFWSIAAEVLGDAHGHPPTDADVTSYWAALVDANRDRLVAPDVADLIHPGQVFVLPPVT